MKIRHLPQIWLVKAFLLSLIFGEPWNKCFTTCSIVVDHDGNFPARRKILEHETDSSAPTFFKCWKQSWSAQKQY